MARRFFILLVTAGAAFAASAGSAAADVVTQTSSNWAGYAVTGSAFTSVSATWVQPTATCTSAGSTWSAFWVGLGGFDEDSEALEQIGTAADCSASGKAAYTVWYELVPAAPVTVKLKVRPGDVIAASVAVTGQAVTLKLRNVTTKGYVVKKLRMAEPDVSSAEWIAEAPSTCTSSGRCDVLPLTNFGTVAFSAAKATAAGHTGTISDAAWSAVAIELRGGAGGFFPSRFVVDVPAADALPAPLSTDGASFAVAWQQASTTPTEPAPPQPAGNVAP